MRVYENGEETYISNSGNIWKEFAEQIVKEHNDKLKINQNTC